MKKIFVYTLLLSLSLTQGASAAAEAENDLLNAFENAETFLEIPGYHDEESDTNYTMNHDETLTAQSLGHILHYKRQEYQIFQQLPILRMLINNIKSGLSFPFTYEISFQGLSGEIRPGIPFWIQDTPYLLWRSLAYSQGRPVKLLLIIIDTSEFTVLYPKTRTQHMGLSLGIEVENREAFHALIANSLDLLRYDRDGNRLLLKSSENFVTSIPLTIKRKRDLICRNPNFPEPFIPFA